MVRGKGRGAGGAARVLGYDRGMGRPSEATTPGRREREVLDKLLERGTITAWKEWLLHYRWRVEMRRGKAPQRHEIAHSGSVTVRDSISQPTAELAALAASMAALGIAGVAAALSPRENHNMLGEPVDIIGESGKSVEMALSDGRHNGPYRTLRPIGAVDAEQEGTLPSVPGPALPAALDAAEEEEPAPRRRTGRPRVPRPRPGGPRPARDPG